MDKLIVAPSPHFHSKRTTSNIMLDVIIALCPAIIASVVIFGWRAWMLILTCVASCVFCEYLCRRVMKRAQTVGDFSSAVTGILLAMNLPVTISPVLAIFGSVIAIVVVKQMFGGIGQNFVNPALTARIVLLNSFTGEMTHWTEAFDYTATADTVSSATPLALQAAGEKLPTYLQMLLGTHGGCLGESCALAILIGGLYLLVRRVISPTIPLTYLGTVVVCSLLLNRDPLFDLLTGGLLLGAFFMATDYTTSPMYFKGKIVFAVGCGLLTMIIREFGSLPEGVSYAIVLMNIFTPLIERYIKPKAFGVEEKRKMRKTAI